MASLILGISVGFFMYAFVNSRYNKTPWANSKYIFIIGVVFLFISLLLLLDILPQFTI